MTSARKARRRIGRALQQNSTLQGIILANNKLDEDAKELARKAEKLRRQTRLQPL